MLALLSSAAGALRRHATLTGVLEHGAGEPLDHHQAAIPDVLVFTYRINLLTVSNIELDDTDLLLQNNVHRTIRMHNSSGRVRVNFYDDDACEELLRSHLPELVPHFLHEERGSYKGDICRGAALVATGGLYFDVDMETIVDSRTLIRNDTRFVSPQIVNDKGKPMPEATIGGFFQSFIAATPNHPILREYLDQILYWYDAQQPNLNPSLHDAEEGRITPYKALNRAGTNTAVGEYQCFPELLGVCMLARAFKKIGEEKRQIWWELRSRDLPSEQLRLGLGDQLGVGSGCNYVVFDPVAQTVPFWSRTVGASPTLCRTDARTIRVSRERAGAPEIPNLLIFTHRLDLLQAKSEELQSTEQALRANAQNTIELHRDQNASVVFYDDDACALLLQEVEPRLMRHWRNETRDMHRSALCRGAALLKTGGLVFDAELECRLDVRKLIFAQTRFVAPFAVPRNIAPVGKEPVLTGRVFLPSFVGAAPRHPILRDFVSRMLDWYEGGQPTLDACDSDFMGSCLLLRAFNAVGEERRQMWEEMHANDIPADEIRRSVGAQDGEGCCCNFLVYDKLTRKIPFWSHAVGANPGTCDVRSSSDGGWSW